MSSTQSNLRDGDLPAMLDDVPRILGYGAVAELTPIYDRRAISGFFYESIRAVERGEKWLHIPRPDFMLDRGTSRPELPGWLRRSVDAWLADKAEGGERSGVLSKVPRILGYGAVAELTPRRDRHNRVMVDDELGHFIPLQSSTISSYYHDSLDQGRWVYVPRPDFILLRGEERRPALPLPGWLEATVRAWHRERPGAGNRTRGADRRGGRTTSSGAAQPVA